MSRSRDDLELALTRLELKHGITPPPEQLNRLLAKQIGDDLYVIEGELLTAAELNAKVHADYEADHPSSRFKESEPARGAEALYAAQRLLRARGIDEPTYEELAEALVSVS